jgi:membrane-bound serine protease (ClpP class)
MPHLFRLAVLGTLLIAGAGLSLPAARTAASSSTDSRAVYVADVNAVIHPISAEYMVQTMERADGAGAALVVFILSTPGGLLDSTRVVVSRMLAARTPIAVFVAPSGARAASAGFLLTIAADIAAMAPGTHIGAAHPVTGTGAEVDDTMKAKMESDVAAYARTLADGRHRNVALAEQAVVSSRAFTEREARSATPPLIDVVASDVDDLLRRIDGRTIDRLNGSAVTLRTSNPEIVRVEMSARQRVLSAIAHPNIAFILLSLGVLGLTIELWSPGAVLPGVIGAISLLLAFFALQMLPVNYTGVLLLALGVLLLVLEVKVTSYGLLTLGGIVSLVLGAMLLIDAPEPELRLGFRFVAPVIIAGAAIAAGLVRLGVAVQRQRPFTGAAALVGASGEAMSPVSAATTGQVRVRGELWRAVSSQPIAPGARVTVTDVAGLTLTVRRHEDAP